MKTKLLFVTMFLIACFKMGGLTAQTLVGYWNFNTGANGVAWNAPIPATTGAATITAGTWTWGDLLFTDGFAGSTLNGISGETAGASLSLRNNAMNGNYIQFEFSMSGSTDLEISYWSRRTSTGFNSNQWSWSTDGLGFTDFGDVINPSSASAGAIVAITAPAALDNAANVYLRYTLDGATAATGNNRIDNLQLNAVQIGAVPLPTDFTAMASGTDVVDLGWNLNTANNPVLLAWSADGVFGDPTGVYSPGDPVVGGGIVLYAGSNTSYNHTLLNPGTVYNYALWSKDGANYSEAATAMAETWPLPSYTTLPYTETFDADLGDCYTYSVSGNTRFWMHGAFEGNGYALMNGFNSGELEEDWLILPGINLDNYSAPVMSFETSWNFGSEDDDNYLKLFYSTNYTGVGSPALATWTEIPFTKPVDGNYVWGSSGEIDLSAIQGTAWLGFKYNYFGNYRRWQVDNILIEDNATFTTFNVDMTDAANFTPGVDVVYLAGSFPGASWNEPGTNPDLLMQPQSPGSMIYTLSLALPDGFYEYKYFKNAGWDGGEWGGGTNRNVNVSGTTVVNDVWGIVFSENDVTFNVDMTDAASFDPLTEVVYLAGSFPGASWNEPGSNPNMLMQPQTPGSMIYTLTLQLPDGSYDYKYFRNAGWGGGEWGEGPNRNVVVAGSITLDDVWGVIGGPVSIHWANLQWPPNGIITLNESFMVYAQINIPGLTGGNVAISDVSAWIGINTSDATNLTDFESGWTWLPADFNTSYGANDEYQIDLGSVIPSAGTYYYASRFQYNGGDYVYGGFDGGFWDGVSNVSGILTVNDIATENTLILLNASAFPTMPVDMQVVINNDDPFTGFQFDIELPAGFAYLPGSIMLDPARENGHMIDAEVLPGNILRILSYSATSQLFLGNGGTVAHFSLSTPGFSGLYNLHIVGTPVIGDINGNNILTNAVGSLVTLLSTGNVAQVNDLEIDFGQPAHIELEITNSDAFAGFQMDVVLPDGTSYAPGTIALTGRAADHEISATVLPGNVLRVLAWSMTNAAFSGIDGPVATFHLEYAGVDPGVYPLTLAAAIIGDANGNNILNGMFSGTLTLNAVLANIMLIKDAEGFANLPAHIELEVQNNFSFTGFQLDIPLPEGFSYVDGSAVLDPLRKVDHEIVGTQLAGNILRLVSYSMTNTPFVGNNGNVATFHVITAPSPGMYELAITNGILGNAAGINILTGTESGMVNVLPSTNCPADFDVCINDEPFALTGGEPAGGTYSGPGVSNGTFNPSAAGVGTHEIVYAYTFPNDQVGECSFFITVNALPVVICPDDFTVCEGSDPVTLSGGSPAGGVYSGPGVSNGIFNPATAGLGSHVIVYTYTDGNACAASCEFTLTVAPILPVSVSIVVDNTVVCDGNAAVATATPVNGGSNPVYTWFVNGIQSGGNTAQFTWFPLNGDVVSCELISSELCNSGSATSNSVAITVNPWVNVSLTIISNVNEVCAGTPATFTVTDVQNPGSDPVYQWQVNGVNVGENSTTFEYVPEDGDEVHCKLTSSLSCTLDNPVFSNTVVMTIYPLPVVIWTYEFDTVCLNWGPIPLSGGTPEGGVYSGPGVQEGFFVPQIAGLGEHTLIYTYTTEFGCSNTAEINIFVDGCVGIEDVNLSGLISIYPNPASDVLHLTVPSEVVIRQISVIDVQGRNLNVIDNPSGANHIIPVNELKPGIYFLRINSLTETAIKRFIVR